MLLEKLRQIGFSDLLRSVAAFVFLIGAATYIIVDIGLPEIGEAFGKIPSDAINLAVLAVCLTVLLSCFRYKMILKTFGIDIGWRSAFFANLVGIFGGLLFFQIVGQTITRVAFLRRFDIPAATVLVTNLYERFIALAWLTILATIGAIILYGSIAVDWSGNTLDLLKLALFAPPAIILGIYMSSRRMVRLLFRKMVNRASLANISIGSILTIATHFSTMIAYIFLLDHASDVSLISLISATVVVMFAASLPISFAGWGIRELSAALAFTAVGVETDLAVAAALIIGFINLAILVFAILIGVTLGRSSNQQGGLASDQRLNVYKSNNRVLTRALSWVTPVMCGVLVMMQLQIPVADGAINFNAGDPLALVGGVIFFLSYLQHRNRSLYWRLPSFEIFIIAVSLTLILSFAIGLAQYGLIDWALINRLIGWGVIIAYLATGALIATAFGYPGQVALARCFVFATTALVALDVFAIALNSVVFISPISWLSSIVAYGLSNNPNSYALQVLFSLVLLTTMPVVQSKRPIWVALIIAIAAAGVFYAKSRTGHGTIIIVMLLLLLSGTVRWRVMAQAAVIFAAILSLPMVFFHSSIFVVDLVNKMTAIQIDTDTTAEKSTANFVRGSYKFKAVSTHWDNHRWHSINTGLEMWRERPIFGAGLGAFIHTEAERSNQALVIHSTPVWVLTELGLVGFILIYGAAAFYALKILPAVWARAGPERALFGVLIVFAVYQLPHDIFYQRTFWLILGCMAAKLVISRSRHQAEQDDAIDMNGVAIQRAV